jgi:hypothetical protein
VIWFRIHSISKAGHPLPELIFWMNVPIAPKHCTMNSSKSPISVANARPLLSDHVTAEPTPFPLPFPGIPLVRFINSKSSTHFRRCRRSERYVMNMRWRRLSSASNSVFISAPSLPREARESVTGPANSWSQRCSIEKDFGVILMSQNPRDIKRGHWI